MEIKRDRFTRGLLVAALSLVGLGACGGTTSPQVSTPVTVVTPISVPGVGAAQQAGADIEQLQQAAPDVAGEEGVDESVSNLPTEPEPVTEIDPEPGFVAEQDPGFVPDVALINGAAEVGCEAEAGLFNSTMLELINASRSEFRMCGARARDAAPVLAWNNLLAETARIHAVDMTTNNFFSHTGSDGLGVSDRATAAGFIWRAVGENIAAGQRDQAEVHQGWLDSEGHCVNIMNQEYTEVGAACVSDESTDFVDYWVVVFGDAR